MNHPWVPAEPLDAQTFARLRRRVIFDCCKWDPQVEDVCTVSDVPIVLAAEAWRELSGLAESLAREVQAAEDELAARPDLHATLGLPRRLRKGLAMAADEPPRGVARIVRFDFHHTEAGWRISEANTDVPGGLNEASGLGALMSPWYSGAGPAGDVADAYARALTRGRAPYVALVHATAYTDDRQVMTYLSRRLEEQGARVALISPAHLRWRDAHASVESDWTAGRADAVVRFFPAEWLPNLPSSSRWHRFCNGAATALSNPATSVLTQSKRFPLVWSALRTPMPTWRALLPETRDPREASWGSSDEWVLKPALGRVGESVGVPGVVPRQEWDRIARHARRAPSQWVAQRRFAPTPLRVREVDLHPGIGVYTIDGRVAGAYGRLASRPLIDATARDAAVLVASAPTRARSEEGTFDVEVASAV